ncbi:hypothetical protein BLNAU_7397 [Blattamonas nauphoetae]|uniref:Uncharacterized protein n=1 Tax=Blattamonas nauphoetae TaxID=2049346 RepID=A0ABQ9Y177_9EUKA|nr:hypothetical protein BLNAU_7397 [Blattamonas nauphoetae]
MTEIDKKTDPSSSQAHSDLSSPQSPVSADCSPFLNWNEEKPESEWEKASIFESLVATLKLQPALDVSLETKAVKFLKSLKSTDDKSVDSLLSYLGVSKFISCVNFAKSIVVLLSSASKIITVATVEIIEYLFTKCYLEKRNMLVTADLLPKLINTLNPRSCLFAEAVEIHACLMDVITKSLHLATPGGVFYLESEAGEEQQAIHETILKLVLAPSEKYICHLCLNRFSIIDGVLPGKFMLLLANLLQISPYYQPTLEFVLSMPIVITIPSYLTFFEDDMSIWVFLYGMVETLRKCNREGGEVRQIATTVHRMLRMEGFEDTIENRLQNDKTGYGATIIFYLIGLNNLLGMNLSYRW